MTGLPAGGGPIRLFVCDDAADFRLLLRYAAEDEPGLELVGEAADGEEGIAGVAATGPDVVLVDLSMPRVDGLEAIPHMLAAAPAARIVAMSGFPAEHMERRARDAGAAAYLQKGADLTAIVDSVRQVAAGGRGEGRPVRVRRIVPDLHASDPAASAGFYADVLGLEVVMDLGWIVTYAAPRHPDAQLSVMREDATAPVRPDVSIEVDDVDAAHAAARRLGCEIVHPLTDEPWGVRRFFVRDPSGRVLNILGHR